MWRGLPGDDGGDNGGLGIPGWEMAGVIFTVVMTTWSCQRVEHSESSFFYVIVRSIPMFRSCCRMGSSLSEAVNF